MSADYIISNLPRVDLDPDDDQAVLNKAIATTASASKGQLTDFSVSSVAGSILKGVVFARLELKWFLNKVVVAIAIELLRLFGVVRDAGKPSTGSITVVLKNQLLTPYVLPAGYRFLYRSADTGVEAIELVTTEQLSILPNATSGQVKVTTSRVGSDTNIDRLGFYSQGIGAYMAYAYNEEPINGGTDLEPLEDTVARGQRAIRQRNTLVTLSEYEDAAKSFLGSGSQVTAFAAMDAARQRSQPGHVHLVCSLAKGKLPSTALLAALQQTLAARSFATASIWVSAYTKLPAIFDVVVQVNSTTDLSDSLVLSKVSDYLYSLPLGATIPIKELEYLIRGIPGVTGLQYVTINGDALNTPMPDRFTRAFVKQLTITKIDRQGNSVTSYPEAVVDPD